MPIKLNGTTFNNGGTAKFNGTTIKEIKFGSTTVWKAQETIFPDASRSWNNAHVGNTSVNSATGTSISLTSIWWNHVGDYACARTVNAVDVTSYSNISFSMTCDSNGGDYNYIKAGIHTNNTTALTSTLFRQAETKVTSNGSTYTLDVNVEGLSGTYYIYVGFYANYSNWTWTVNDITLE